MSFATANERLDYYSRIKYLKHVLPNQLLRPPRRMSI